MGPDKISPTDKEHLERLLELHPELGSALGIPGHDDRLPDLSTDGRRATDAVLAGWRDARAALEKAPPGEGQREFDLDQRVFSASLELLRFCEEELRWRDRDPDTIFGLRAVLVRDLFDARERPERFEALARRLAAVPAYLTSAKDGVSEADSLLLRGALDVTGATGALVDAIAKEAARAAEQQRIPAAVASAIDVAARAARAALDERWAWLETLPTQDGAWRLGRERFDTLLHLRALDITAAEMRELSRSMVEQMRIEERRVATRLLRKRDLGAAAQLARAQTPLSFDEVLSWGGELVEQARAFLGEGDLFTLPHNSDLVVAGAPAGVSAELDRATLLPAPRLAPEGRARLLLEPPNEDELSRYSVADLENVAACYGYPGAHLLLSAARERTSLLRDGAPLGLTGGPATLWAVETRTGWAHHGEELMRELLFRDSPAARFVACRRATYRATLARVEVGLHAAEMSLDVAVKHLKDLVGLSEAEARRDVMTCVRRPSRALSDLLGKMRVQQLRRDAKLAWRDAYTDRRLHDLLLRGGAMPLTYHFELLDAPPVYAIDDGTAEYSLGEDDPLVPTSEETAGDDEGAGERSPSGDA